MLSPRTEKFKALEFLCDNRLAVLSTISSKTGKPESSLVYYVVDEKFPLFVITTKQSRKIANITKNQNISLVVSSEIPPQELQIEGTAEIIHDSAKKNRIAELYLEISNKNPDTINWPPVMKLPNTEGFDFIKITINNFKYSDFTEREGSIVQGTLEDWK